MTTPITDKELARLDELPDCSPSCTALPCRMRARIREDNLAIFADRWRCAWAVVGEAVALRPGGAGVELLNWKIGDDPIDWNDVYDRARAWLDANRGTR